MKKIGIILIIFGVFFPIILSLYTDFKGKGINLRNIKSGYVGKIAIKNVVYYTDEEYEEIKKTRERESKEIEKKLKTVVDPTERIKLILKSLPDPPKIRTPEVAVTILYVDCLAFSIIIFAVGLGFILLSKKIQEKGGEPD